MVESLGQHIARDGTPLSFRKWSGQGDVIIYLHGIESNSGWFSQFASKLNENGFTLYGIDRRGSGLNKEDRGDVRDYNIFLDDIEDAVTFVKEQNIGKKVFLMGICWGGLLAVNYAAERRPSVDGLILLSPAIYRRVDLNFFIKFIARLCLILHPDLHFAIPIRDEMFTKNRRYLDFIKNDAMRLRNLSCRFFNEIMRMEKEASLINRKINLPLCVLLAGHDDIVDNDKVMKWFNELESEDKTIKVFSDLCHVLPFEENINELIEFITVWIRARESVFESHSIKN